MLQRQMQIRLRNDVVVWKDGIRLISDLEGEQSVAGVQILVSRWSLEGNFCWRLSMDVLGTMNA